MQAVSKALALQMQQLQQQVTDSISAAAMLRQDKQAAADQLHQVCTHLLSVTNIFMRLSSVLCCQLWWRTVSWMSCHVMWAQSLFNFGALL